MANGIRPDDLGAAIEQELTVYHDDVVKKVNKLSKDAVSKLVKITRQTAPEGARGSYKKSIASTLVKKGSRGETYAWHVKAPDYRLTHLLVHGHATRDGGRTKANPFLQNAVDQVLPEYEKNVEEAVKNG